MRRLLERVLDGWREAIAPIIGAVLVSATLSLLSGLMHLWRLLTYPARGWHGRFVVWLHHFKRVKREGKYMFDIQARAKMGGALGTDEQLIVIAAVLDSLVGNLVTAAPVATGVFNACTAHLFKNAFTVDENTLKADLTEATFPGYAASAALVFSTAGIDDAGNHIVVADVPAAWHCTGDPVGELIHGLYLLGAGAAPLLCGVTFPAPIAISLDQVIPATIVLQVGNNA